MGLGDAKFVLAFGFLLSPTEALLATMLAFWVGAIVGLSLITIQKLARLNLANNGVFKFFPLFKYLNFSYLNLRSEIAFGPFLFLGGILNFLVGDKILNWYIQIF